MTRRTSLVDVAKAESAPLAGPGGDFEYRFDPTHLHAVNVAWAAGRPLLIRGEPGVGKSQLARAVAKHTQRRFLSTTVTARTEPEELLFELDVVARLAEAQLVGALFAGRAGGEGAVGEKDLPAVEKQLRESIRAELDPSRFVRPGILWWAFHRSDAAGQAGLCQRLEEGVATCPFLRDGEEDAAGAVVLIDEIDKADAAVPNGLLEALGDRRFSVPLCGREVSMQSPHPLVVVTTNAERSLPDAFVRRCMVLKMDFPTEAELVERGRSHTAGHCSDTFLEEVANALLKVRAHVARTSGERPPGQAEFIDLVRALARLAPDSDNKQRALLDQVQQLAFGKQEGLSSQLGQDGR